MTAEKIEQMRQFIDELLFISDPQRTLDIAECIETALLFSSHEDLRTQMENLAKNLRQTKDRHNSLLDKHL